MFSSDTSSKRPFILIGVALGCLVLAGAVFGTYRTLYSPTLKVVDNVELRRLTDKLQSITNAPKFPSLKMRKWLEQLRSKNPKLREMSHTSMLMAGILDPDNTEFRTWFFLNMESADFDFLVFSYAQTVHFEADAVVRPEEESSTMDKVQLEVQDMPSPTEHGFDQKLRPLKTLYMPLSTHRDIEVAGMAKGAKVIDQNEVVLPNFRSKRQFGDDYAGVSKDGRILVLSDGVSAASDSVLAARVAVELTIEFFERHSEAHLETHSWRLLDAIVRFLRKFNMYGKATLTVVELKRGMTGTEIVVLNVGDSGCAVVSSSGEVLKMTPAGQHQFNMPHQLPSSLEGKINANASARNAKLYRASVPSGARVVVYSDGVSDNLWPATIGNLQYAGDIAAAAVHVIRTRATDIPISKAAGEPHKGKNDDISVIVSRL